jgi:urocanate hydratase
MAAMAEHVRAMLALQQRGAIAFDYGNNIRAQARQAGVANAFDIPGFVPEYIRPLFCEGRGPFRWAALSATRGHPRHRRAALEMFGHDESLVRWIHLARERVAFQGCRRASSGSATASVRGSACASTSWCAKDGQGADRHRPRSSRHRIGRLSQS